MDHYQNDEMVIDLADMIFFLLKKWRVLVVMLVIGALLGSGLALLPSEPLNEEDIKESTYFDMTRAAQFYTLIQQQMEYNDNSILMTSDPNSMYYGELQYHVRADSELNLVKAKYTSLLDQTLKSEIGAAAGYDVEQRYLDEIIEAEVHLVTDGKGDNSTASLDIYYTLTADSAEKCESMLAVLREAVSGLESELSRKYADFEASYIMDMVAQHDSGTYITHQENKVKHLTDLLTSFQTVEGKLSEEEIAYYRTELCGIEPEEESILISVIKQAIIFAFVGAVLWGVWYVVAYLLNKSVKTATEAMELCGVPLLGRLEDSTKTYKGIDKLLHKMQAGGKRSPDSLSYLVSLIAGMNYGNAVLCGNRQAPEVVAVMDAVQQVCPGIKGANFIAASEEALRQAKADGQEILLIRTGKTKKSEVERELNLCKHQGIQLLGLIVID